MQGSMYLRQLSFGYLDMAFYGDDNQVDDVLAHEDKALEKTQNLLIDAEGERKEILQALENRLNSLK